MANEMSAEQYAESVFEEGGQLVVNLDGVAEQSFELIPKGIYNAIVESCEYKISNNSGKPMFEFQFAIDGGDFAGRKLYYYASFSEKALSGTKTALLRIDPTIFSGPFKPQQIAEEGHLLGKPLRVKIKHEEYNGEPQARVQAVLAAAAGTASGGDGFFGG